jgi:hypothetical protein
MCYLTLFIVIHIGGIRVNLLVKKEKGKIKVDPISHLKNIQSRRLISHLVKFNICFNVTSFNNLVIF